MQVSPSNVPPLVLVIKSGVSWFIFKSFINMKCNICEDVYTSEEAEPAWENMVGFGHDHNLTAVQGYGYVSFSTHVKQC